MPRNRRPRDREEKRQEIVDAAAALFTELGFEQTSMARIAQAAGVTPTTIYWYVADKDALLVAVLDHLLADALQRFAQEDHDSLVDQVLWALDRLQRHRNLVNVVHTRSEISAAVAEWHHGFHALVDAIVIDDLTARGIADQDSRTIAQLTTFAVEGLLAHPQDPATARAILEQALGESARP